MGLLQFLGTTLLVWVAQVAALFLVPVAVKKADPATGRLPKEYSWLETPDALGWGAGTYEPVIKKVYDEKGKEAALEAWLLRNKAYALREGFRADIDYGAFTLTESGPRIPPKWGFWCWKGNVTSNGKTYFDAQPGVSFGFAYVYLRCGWKLKPLFVDRNDRNPVIGFFEGITPRSDDWDDFPETNSNGLS